EGRTVREVARDAGVLDEQALDDLLDPHAMTEPGLRSG
ncbi:MAG: hypothetical protein OER86_10990, partial [Phycisphaerae bacterium]|nr:hypothetical protein [Phycisphaerae bacterium]